MAMQQIITYVIIGVAAISVVAGVIKTVSGKSEKTCSCDNCPVADRCGDADANQV
jgi:uncharacterized membrane protein YuzA (DUF378 family)